MLAFLPLMAQEVAQDTTAVAQDTTEAPKPVVKPKVPRNKDGTRIYSDTAIYQGMNLKLDIANTIMEAAISKGKILSFEAAWNIRLKQRYYPTFEVGYAQAKTEAEGGAHDGKGGFFRVGVDINGLKKHPERLNALLVGVRLGTAVQNYSLSGVTVYDPYWGQGEHKIDFANMLHADCWGEVVAGCQVQVWEGFQMGWYVRIKIMFTLNPSGEKPVPYYVPGFGYRDNMNWGLNYYIGYKF